MASGDNEFSQTSLALVRDRIGRRPAASQAMRDHAPHDRPKAEHAVGGRDLVAKAVGKRVEVDRVQIPSARNIGRHQASESFGEIFIASGDVPDGRGLRKGQRTVSSEPGERACLL